MLKKDVSIRISFLSFYLPLFFGHLFVHSYIVVVFHSSILSFKSLKCLLLKRFMFSLMFFILFYHYYSFIHSCFLLFFVYCFFFFVFHQCSVVFFMLSIYCIRSFVLSFIRFLHSCMFAFNNLSLIFFLRPFIHSLFFPSARIKPHFFPPFSHYSPGCDFRQPSLFPSFIIKKKPSIVSLNEAISRDSKCASERVLSSARPNFPLFKIIPLAYLFLH